MLWCLQRAQFKKEDYMELMTRILAACRQAEQMGTGKGPKDRQKMYIRVLENGLLQEMNVLPYLPRSLLRI